MAYPFDDTLNPHRLDARLRTGLCAPAYLMESSDAISYVYDIEHRALFTWSQAARRIMWHQFTYHAKYIPGVFGGHYEGDAEAAHECDEKIFKVIEVVDIEKLWQNITDVSLYDSMDNWKCELGTYGWCLTKNIFDNFEKVVTKMFPFDDSTDPQKVFVPAFPDGDERGRLTCEAATAWASELLVENGVVPAFKAYRAGVPLEDIVAKGTSIHLYK